MTRESKLFGAVILGVILARGISALILIALVGALCIHLSKRVLASRAGSGV